jgi:uncharacterized protein (TIGR00251 family)
MLYAERFYNYIARAGGTARMRYFVAVRFGSGGVTVSGEEIEVWIRSPPERGRANRELVKKLAEYFGVPEAGVWIVSGLASKKKIVEIKMGAREA